MALTEEHLLKIYDLVFSDTHSIGFKTAEIKDLLFQKDYWFLQRPKENWKKDLMEYLDKIDFDKSLLKMNPDI